METTFTPDEQPDMQIVEALGTMKPLDMPIPGDEPSMLDQLKLDLREQVSKPIVLPVPGRAGYALRCRTDLSASEMQRMFKQASKGKNTTDNILLAKLVLVQATLVILKDGKPLVDDEGEQQKFDSDQFRDALGLSKNANVIDAVAPFIGRDGDVTALFDTVVEASGYGATIDAEDLEQADPTSGVS